MVLTIQLLIIFSAVGAVALLAWYFPFPSPLIRPFLPPKKRWPEMQIRGWLQTGGFHPGYLGYFYRDPERVAPAGGGLLAPADGLITSADARDGTRYIVIALSFWDMHTQRSAVAGRVVSVERLGDTHTDGEGREFAFLRDKLSPVQARIALDSAAGRIAIRLITSVAARRIETWVEQGETIERGQRIGRILLGSTVVLELPADWPVLAVVGDRVRAGQSLVAQCGAEQ